MFKDFRHIIFSIIILIFSLVPVSSFAEQFKTTLENGMTVILEENHSAPAIAFQMWVGVGSADEDENIAGIAHVFEHMLFKGTKRRQVGEIAKEIDEAGGSINAFTSYDHTVYHLVLASRYFDKGLDIIADAIQDSSFAPDELAREVEVVLEELKMGEDEPSRRLYLKLSDTAYTTHPYKRPVIGFRETVKGLKRQDILNFFERWYVPNNMTLVVVGDFDREKALSQIKEAFKDFKPKDEPHKKRAVEPEQRGFRGFVDASDIKEARLGLAFHVPELTSPDTYPIDALALILGQGESSRLYQKLKGEVPVATSISSYAMTPKEPGMFFITSTLETEKIRKALQIIADEIEHLKYEGITDKELEKAKLNLESEFIYSRETMEGRARQLGYYERTAGGLDYEKRYLEGISKLTSKDIQRAAEKYLTISNMTIGLIVPKDSKALITLDEVRKTVEEAVNNSKKDDKPSAFKTKLANGITLIVREDHTNPVAAIYAAVEGGIRFEDEKTNGLSNFIAKMFTKGTKKRTSFEIASELDSMAGSLNGFSGRNAIGISGKFLSRFFDKGFEILADSLQNPVFSEDEIEKTRKEILSEIKNQEDYLPGYTFNIFSKTLYEEHPYRMNLLGTNELVGGYKREDLLRFYKSIVHPDAVVLSVVGDVDTAYVVKRANELFAPSAGGGAASGTDKTKKGLPVEKKRAFIKRAQVFKEKQQAHIAIGFLGAAITDKDRYALRIISSIMSGQGGRLFIELRDKKPLAYSVAAVQRDGIEPGFFAVYMGTSPDKVNEGISGILDEFKKLVGHGVTDEELKRAKAEIVGNYELGLQEVSDRASDMALNELFGLGYDEYNRFSGKIESVTKEEILSAAKKYFVLNAYTIVIVGQKK